MVKPNLYAHVQGAKTAKDAWTNQKKACKEEDLAQFTKKFVWH
jgi:hypothetical protein